MGVALCPTIVYTNMEFEWDRHKSEGNFKKHKVRFDDAAPLFIQAGQFTYISNHSGTDGVRYVTVGVLKGKLFAAVYTLRGDTIRIISVRRARRGEEKKYRELQFGRIH